MLINLNIKVQRLGITGSPVSCWGFYGLFLPSHHGRWDQTLITWFGFTLVLESNLNSQGLQRPNPLNHLPFCNRICLGAMIKWNDKSKVKWLDGPKTKNLPIPAGTTSMCYHNWVLGSNAIVFQLCNKHFTKRPIFLGSLAPFF